MNVFSLFVQFVVALPKLWDTFKSILEQLKKMEEKRTEDLQQEAIDKLKASKPNTEERKDALRDWVDSNRD